jgi:hypothetical protein
MKIARRTNACMAAIAAAVILLAGIGNAAEVRTLGRLVLPRDAGVAAVCTDPVVQSVLNDDLRAEHRNMGSDPGSMVTLTVTVNEQVLAPGVSLNQMFPGDPSMVEMLKSLGAEAPPLGDSGNQPTDPFELEARRRELAPDDPLTAQFKSYQTMQHQLTNAPTPYEKIPKNQIYDTIIVARASAEGSLEQFKVVAVVHAGDDAHRAKELVAEEIANAVLH